MVQSELMRHKHKLMSFVLLAFAVICLLALHKDLATVSLVPVLHAWPLLMGAIVLSLINYMLRITRWQWYLARLGHHFNFSFSGLTYVAGFAFTLSPGKVGEVIRARYYRDAGVPLAHVGAAFFTERLLDVAAMALLSLLIVEALPGNGLNLWGVAAVVAAVAVLATFMPWQRWIARYISGGDDAAVSLLQRAVRGLIATFANARRLLGPDLLWSGFALGLLAWTAEGIGLYVLASIYPDAHLQLLPTIGIYAVAVIVGALSFLPGGLGSTEAMMTMLLVAQGVPVSEALVITLLCRLVTLWLAILLGWLAIFGLRRATVPVTEAA